MSERKKQSSERHVGLYYPYVLFSNEEWLKMAALYWDRMARIVPEGYAPNDSPTVTELKSPPYEFVVDLAPSEQELYAVASHFLNLIAARADELRQRYAVQPDGDEAVQLDHVPARMSVMGDKMYHDLKDALESEGLAVIRPDEQGLNRVFMHRKLGNVYMAALAEEMAPGRLCHPVSNTSLEHLAVSGLTVERLGQALLDLSPPKLDSQEIEAAMALVTFRMVLPKGLAHVPVARLMKFRREHREQLSAHQAFIAGLAGPKGSLSDLQKVTDQKALEMQLKVEYERTVVPELNRLRAAFSGIEVDTVDSAVSVRLPQTIPLETDLAAVGMAPDPHLLAGGMLGLLIFKVVRSKRVAARKAIEKSPAAYLMSVQEEFSPHTLLERLAIHARRFALGV